MNTPPVKHGKPLNTGLLVVSILGGLLLLTAAAAAFFFIRYRQTASQHVDASQSQVMISQPQNMAQFPVDTIITVEVDAIGMQPFTSTELWINGVLLGVQAGPSGGTTSLTTVYTWIPAQPGNYSLVARAFNTRDEIVTSPAVIVFINPAETENQPPSEVGEVAQTGDVAQIVLPASPSGYSGPPPPASIDIPVPAVKWKGSPGDWLTHLITTVPPAAPELTAIADGCNVKLDIHDLSENEEGFALYRQTTGDSDWVLVSNFAAHSGEGWIGYLDNNMSGGITYYATAFNSKGETSSNLVMVNIDPQICPQAKSPLDIQTLRLKIENLNLDGQAGSIYCYRRLGNGHWSRWPDLGFLASDGAGKTIPLLIDPHVLTKLDDAASSPITEALDLQLECWGWQAGKLRSLGNFHERIDLAKLTGIHAAFPGLAFDISPDIIGGFKREAFLLGSGMNPWITQLVDPYSVEHLGYVPEFDQMPLIHLWVSYDKNDCMSHIEGPFEQEMNCYPMPGFNQGPGGANPQPYLIWDVNNEDCEGSPAKECFSMNWWEKFAERYPDPYNDTPILFKLEEIYLTSGGNAATFGWGIDKTQQASRLYPGFPPVGEDTCFNGNQFYMVSLVANTSLGEITSPPSNFVAVPCPQKLEEVQIEVAFTIMELYNIDDGSGDSTADNVYGQFAARINGELGAHLRIGWWNGDEPHCEYFGSMCIPTGENGYISDLDNGTYNLATDFQLCNPAVTGSCTSQNENDFFYNNNKLVVTMKGGESLQLFSELYDYDELSPDDPLCNQFVWVGPRTLEQWAATSNEPYNLIQPEGDSTCNLQVILNALKPGQ
jgi:hypothetical protein